MNLLAETQQDDEQPGPCADCVRSCPMIGGPCTPAPTSVDPINSAAVLTAAEAATVARFEAGQAAEESLTVRVTQAIRDSNGTPEALAAWKAHPQLIPAHIYADAAIAVMRGGQHTTDEEGR